MRFLGTTDHLLAQLVVGFARIPSSQDFWRNPRRHLLMMRSLAFCMVSSTLLSLAGCGSSNQAEVVGQSDSEKAAYAEMLAEEERLKATMTPEQLGE